MMIFNHGNQEGTGSQLEVELTSPDGFDHGMITFSIRQQSGTRRDFGRHQYTSDGETVVTLRPEQLGHILNVLRGNNDTLGSRKSRGLAESRDAEARKSILYIDAISSPFAGYAVHIKCQEGDSDFYQHGRICLSQAEATALEAALTSAMGRVAFG